MSIALLASCRSPCERLHVGSVITKSNRIVSMGYNGFIAGTPHTSLMREGHEQAIIHIIDTINDKWIKDLNYNMISNNNNYLEEYLTNKIQIIL